MNRTLLTFALIKILEIRQCIWVFEDSTNPYVLFKRFSNNIPIVLTTWTKLVDFFKEEALAYRSTMIILETKSMRLINAFYEELEKVRFSQFLQKVDLSRPINITIYFKGKKATLSIKIHLADFFGIAIGQ